MQLTLLGTGSPIPDPHRAGPSQHLQMAGRSILVDCGNGAARRMVEAGLKPEDLDFIFITHMHSDHTVDLAHVLLAGWIAYRKKPVQVIGPRYTAEFVRRVLHAFELDMQLRHLEDRVGKEMMHIAVQEVGQDDIITLTSRRYSRPSRRTTVALYGWAMISWWSDAARTRQTRTTHEPCAC